MGMFLILLQPFLLFYAGGEIQSRWLKLVYSLSAIAFTVGLFFTIMHWAYGRESIILSLTTCTLIYGYHFVNDFNAIEKKRSIQDYLLLAWFIAATISFIGINDHIQNEYFWYIRKTAAFLLWINLIYAFYLSVRKAF